MLDIENQKYNRVAMALHWLMAALIIFNIASMKFTDFMPREWKSFLRYQHQAVGVILLALIVWRIVWRFTHKVPPLPSDMSPMQVLASRVMHWSLYALMVVVPFTGLMRELTRGRGVGVWLFTIPTPFLDNRELSRTYFGGPHNLLGNVIMFLVAAHILAALYHQFVRRDQLINRMAV